MTALHLFPDRWDLFHPPWYGFCSQQLPWVPEDPGIKVLGGILGGECVWPSSRTVSAVLAPPVPEVYLTHCIPLPLRMLVCYSCQPSNPVDSCFSHDHFRVLADLPAQLHHGIPCVLEPPPSLSPLSQASSSVWLLCPTQVLKLPNTQLTSFSLSKHWSDSSKKE